MRRLSTGPVAATAPVVATAACGSSGSPGGTAANSGPTSVKVGVIPIVDVAPLYLGKQQGLFSNVTSPDLDKLFS